MNRQARRYDTDKWEDFGAVTHVEAAEQFARAYGSDRQMRVMTRDVDSPNALHFHDVTPEVVWHVKSLRGDED